MKILIVCSGNICRSPLAAALLRDRLRGRAAEFVEVTSAGTLGIEGEPAHPLAAQAALEAGVDLSAHISRGLTRDMIEEADLILAMDRKHLDEIRAIDPDHPSVHLLGEFLPEEDRKRGGAEIDDPVGGDEEEFRECCSRLRTSADGIAAAIERGILRERPAREEERAEARYFTTIESHVAAARGIAPALSSMEFHIVDGWWRRGIPLWLALEAMEKTTALWPPGEAPRSLLRHCEDEIARRIETLSPETRSVADAAIETPVPDAIGRARRLLCDALARADPDDAALRAALEVALRDLTTVPPDVPTLEALLISVEESLTKASTSRMTEEEIEFVREVEAARLRAIAPRMGQVAFDETLRRLVRARLLRRLSLPALSLLDLLSSSHREES